MTTTHLPRTTPLTMLATVVASMVAAAGAAATPETVLWSAHIENDSGPLDGTVSLTLALYDAESGGALVHEESVASAVVVGGELVHELGAAAGNPIDDEVLDHPALFLQVTVNGETLTPRLPIRSVPYALRAEQCTSLQGLSADDVATDDEVAAALATVSVPYSSITNLPSWLADGELTALAGGGLAVTGNSIGIAAGGVTGSMIANSTITAAKLANDSVGSAAIAADSVGASEIIAGSIGSVEIGDGSIAGADILDSTITGTDIMNGSIHMDDVAGVNVYLSATGCGSVLMLSSTCHTRHCTAEPPIYWYACGGGCSAEASQTCTGSLIGKLVQ